MRSLSRALSLSAEKNAPMSRSPMFRSRDKASSASLQDDGTGLDRFVKCGRKLGFEEAHLLAWFPLKRGDLIEGAADERVSAAKIVVQERKWLLSLQGYKPKGKLREFDRKRVLIDTV